MDLTSRLFFVNNVLICRLLSLRHSCRSYLASIVNFMCQFYWVKRCLGSWWNIISIDLLEYFQKRLTLVVVFCFFFLEINIWLGRLCKGVCPHQCEWALSNPFKAWIDQKNRGMVNSLFPCVGLSNLLCSWTWALLVLRPLNSDQDLKHWPHNSQTLYLNWNLTCTIGSTGSQASELGLYYTPGSTDSPTC